MSAAPVNPASGHTCRRAALAGLAAPPLAVLTGCASFNYSAADAPHALQELRPVLPAPHVALVLGSGGPRGYAHLGVLRVLEEAGIAVDVSARPGSTPPEASAAMRLRDLRRRARIEPEVAQADFLIHPDLGYWAGPWPRYFAASRAIGEAEARRALPALKAKL